MSALRKIVMLPFLLAALVGPVYAQSDASAPSPVTPEQQASPSASAQADEKIPVLKVNVKLVNVFTNVTDATGAVVGGLAKEDFAITEDGRPQKIAVFERQSELPLSLILAIDTSGSVRKDLPLEQEASRKFVRALMRSQDQMSLLEFSTEVRQVVPFTNQVSRIDRGLSSLRPGPATALYDAIYLGRKTSLRRARWVSRDARCWCWSPMAAIPPTP